MERKAKSSTFFTQVDIKFPISLCHQKMKKPSNIFHKIRLFLLSTVAEEKITVSYTLEPAKLYICLCCRMWNRQFRFELFFCLAFRAEVLFEFLLPVHLDRFLWRQLPRSLAGDWWCSCGRLLHSLCVHGMTIRLF